ncbi:MAG: TIR domain-containing protein [Ilumatobacter sp.]|uniref:TIR domain-containing protein n=1 Tax=Ilumatobacter sp. TaxID=1967498 RepID=UPI0026157409|nr:TIR domain-containing protein [Ilumatobacter sp.]MDJ0769749.1 TIR domain-containing protein [Ilumatobacter sp.]
MRLFLSHKAERDKDRAERIKRALESLERSKISVFVSSADIAAAEKWPKRIREELRAADLLLLLYTDPNLDWAWCMYEAGLYARLDGDPDDDDPVTFLHHVRGVPPSQLRDNQGVKATKGEIEKFLTDLLKQAIAPNGKLTPKRRERIRDAAKAIAAEFPDADTYHVSYTVVIDIVKWNPGRGIPLQSRVTTTGSTAAVLGKAETAGMTWGELTEKYRPKGRKKAAWLHELDEAFIEAARCRPCKMAQETFESHEGGVILHPFLHRIDRIAGRPVRAEVAFVAEVAPADIGGPVFAMLRALERNNSEVIEAFLDTRIGMPVLRNDATPTLIQQRLLLIQNDIARARVFERDRVEVFGDTAADAAKLVKRWQVLSDRLSRSCDAKRPNLATIAKGLDKMRETNNALSKLAADRYAQVVDARQ